MPGSRNNTEGVGLHAELSGIEREINKTISAANYRSALSIPESKLGELRKYVLSWVSSSWTREEKIRILQEYGNASLLKKGISQNALNSEVTESIITNLSKSTLEKLMNDIKVKEGRFERDVKQISRSIERTRRGSFLNLKTFQEASENVLQARSVRQYKKARKAQERKFSVPRQVQRQYKSLRRELQNVLSDMYYNVFQLTGLAYDLGIDFPDQTPRKKIELSIINKVCLYVDILLGKSRGQYANAFFNPENFNKLLMYTSFAYVTGKPGINLRELQEQRRAARRGKRLADASLRVKTSSFLSRREMREITGGTSFSFTRRGRIKDLGLNDKGVLKDLSFEELARLAQENGLSIKKYSIGSLKEALYRKIGITERNKKSAETQYQRSLLRGRFDEGSLSKRDAYGDILKGLTGKNQLQKEGSFQSSSGVVRFNEKGELVSKNVFSALAVYVVGSGKAGVIEGEREEDFINEMTRRQGLARGALSLFSKKKKAPQFEDALKELGLEGKDINVKKELRKIKRTGGETLLSWKTQKAEESEKRSEELEKTEASPLSFISVAETSLDKIKYAMPVLVVNSGKLALSAEKVSGRNLTQADLTKGKINKGLRLFDKADSLIEDYKKTDDFRERYDAKLAVEKDDLEKLKESSKKAKKGKVSLSAGISNYARIFGFKEAKKNQDVIPVYTVNREDKDRTYLWLKEYLPKLWMGLQSFAGFNTAAPVALGVMALNAVNDAVDATISSFGIDADARGAKGKAGNKTSHFISGDSLNGKENKEQVSIDWDRKTYNVKPIPKYANGGKENASGRSYEITNTERNAPMSVGISSNLVSYSRILQNVKDDGSGKALKVFAVNPGITDKVDLNGTSISLIELIGSIYTALGTLVTSSAAGTEVLTAIAGNTAMTASSIKSLEPPSSSSSGGFPSNLNSILRGV